MEVIETTFGNFLFEREKSLKMQFFCGNFEIISSSLEAGTVFLI